jgi:hypothetical protein
MRYPVRVGGQLIGALERSEIESRSKLWKKVNAVAEVAADGQSAFMPVDDFLRSAPMPSPAPAPAPAPPVSPHVAPPPPAVVAPSPTGLYDVRIGTQTLPGLRPSEIEGRAAGWSRSSFPITVAPAGTQQFVALDAFLQSQRQVPSPAPQPAPIPTPGPAPTPTPRTTPQPWWPPQGKELRALVAAAVVVVAVGGYFGYQYLLSPSARYERALAHKAAGNYEQAVALFAAIDSPAAEFNLAMLYANGQGVDQDDARAVELLKKAANSGEAAAQTALGIRYAEGDGMPANPQAAIEWYRKAADQGYGWAQMLLGLAYATGDGVAQDFVEADTWFVLAAAAGDTNAAEQRDHVERLMSESERQRATERANQIAERLVSGSAS